MFAMTQDQVEGLCYSFRTLATLLQRFGSDSAHLATISLLVSLPELETAV